MDKGYEIDILAAKIHDSQMPYRFILEMYLEELRTNVEKMMVAQDFRHSPRTKVMWDMGVVQGVLIGLAMCEHMTVEELLKYQNELVDIALPSPFKTETEIAKVIEELRE